MHDEAERVPIFNLCHPHALDVPLGALLQLLLFWGEWRFSGYDEIPLYSFLNSAQPIFLENNLTPLIILKECLFLCVFVSDRGHLEQKPGVSSTFRTLTRTLTLEALKQKAVASVSDHSRSWSTSPLSSVSAR